MNSKYFPVPFIAFSFLLLLPACRKFITVPAPIDQPSISVVFNSDAGATAAVTGIYSEMMNSLTQFSSGYTTLYAGMSADELYSKVPSSKDEFIQNQLTEASHSILSVYFWQPAYKFIYAANSILEQLSTATNISAPVRKSLEGEARFIRAFTYFYLVNFFGDVPLILTTDYRTNSLLPRSAQDVIYDQITKDLLQAQSNLSPVYPTTDRARPNKWTVTALLSRVYLYKSDWINAEAAATEVINSGTYSLAAGASNVFLKASNETIWQLMPVRANFNTTEGNALIPVSATSTPPYLLTPSLVASFETADTRRAAWTNKNTIAGVDYVYPYKYKIRSNATLTEYYVVFRLAELFLIRAEARAQQGNIQSAKNDLNMIRVRAGLPNLLANTQPAILSAVEQERRIELFGEWGHRWFDLKRTGRATALLSPLNPTTWQPTDMLWPIPIDQIRLNGALTQNPGY